MSMLDYILDLFYPPTCLSCDELQIPGTTVPLCPKCQQRWEEMRRQRCPDCKELQTLCRCKPSLLAELSRNTECIHLVPYEQTSLAGRLILIAKDERLPRLTAFFADQLEMAMAVREVPTEPDELILTYLPRSKDRASESGIDQSQALAKALGKRLGLKVSNCFARQNAPPQKNLSATERLRSARRTYRLLKSCPSVSGKTVLLIDDVITSGATMLAGAELLTAAGAKQIYCITVGRASKSEERKK
jgi:ComF family protein